MVLIISFQIPQPVSNDLNSNSSKQMKLTSANMLQSRVRARTQHKLDSIIKYLINNYILAF